MEHKFSFKRLMSLLVVFTMLFSSFAMFAIPAGAEIFWAEGDYTIADNGNYSASHAYGYVFNVKAVNGTIAGEDAVIITNNAAYEASNPKWAAHVLFAPTEDANVYEIIKAIPYAGNAGAQGGYDQGINFENGNILLLVHSSASYPAYEADGVTLKYPNWESKVAAIALANTIGAKATLAGIDLEAGTVDNATVTIQKPEVEEPVDEGPFNYGLNIDLSDNETLLIDEADAIELLTDGNWDLEAEGWGGKHDGVVLVQNKNATVEEAYGMANFIWKFEGTPEPYNTIKFGLYTDVNYMIGYPTEEDVYFSDDGENWVSGYYDLGYGETIPDAYTTLDGVEPTAPGTVVAEIRLEKPQTYKYVKIEFYYPESPFEEKPMWEFFGLTEVFDFSYVEPSSVITDFNASEYWESRYGRGAGSFAFTNADAYTVAYDNFIDYRFAQLAFAPVDGAENVYELVAKGTGENAVEFPANGFVWVAYSAAPEAGTPCAAANDLFATMTIGETYEFVGIDFENGFGANDAEVKKWEAPAEPEEPTPEPAEQHDILVSHVNAYTWGVFNAMVIYGEGQNSESKLGYKCEWWIAIKVDNVDGVLTVTAIEPNDGLAKTNTASADGFILYVFNNDAASFAAAGLVEVGDVLLSADFDWTKGAASETPIGTMSFGPAAESEEPTPEEPTPEEPESTNVLLGVAFDKLTGTYYSYGSAVTDGSELTDGYYITEDNLTTSLYADDKVAGFGGLSGLTLELEGALDATYAIDKIVVYYANGKTGSGICEPATIKAFYKNGDGEWIQFGTTFESTEDDENMKTRYDFLISSVEFTVDTAVEATDIRFELTPRTGKTMVFISELEAWGTEVTAEDPGEDPGEDEDGYKEGLTIEIDDTLVGWIGDAADLETIEKGLTDENWGAGDANDWTNASGIYPFQNKVCTDNTQFPEVNLIYNFGAATKFDTIELGVYSSYNVMIGYPSALAYVYTSADGIEWSEATEAYFDMDIPAMGNEGSVKTTAKLSAALEAQYVKVVLTFPESPFDSKPVWEFMGLTEIALSYNPVTSNVVTDFNPTSYKGSIGGATGAFIYDDADIYAACGNDWWIHVAFVPSEVMEGYYEVAAIRAPTTGNYLTMPENGFIWMAWSDAPATPESAGAYAYNFMSYLKVGDIVDFVGVDIANHTTEADAYAEVWIDPNAPVNVALNKEYTTSGPDDGTYNANLTDGNAFGAVSYDNKWFVFNGKNTVDGIGTAIIDLAGDFDISKVQVNLINNTVDGIAKPEYVKFYVSADNETWEELGEVELQDVQGSAYWTGLENLEVTGRYIKLEMKIGAPFSFLNEIEVYGKAVPAEPVDIELVEGENNITVPALNSAIANTNFDKDYVITIAGQWGVTVFVNGVEYYPNRMGNLEAPLPAGENTVEFKNSAEEDAEIVAIVAAPIVGDTMDDPMILDEAGDYTASVDANYPQGVFYSYIATADGTLTLTITSEGGWTYVINNLTAGIYGDTQWSDSDPVAPSTTINVSAGDEIAFIVGTYDPANPWNAPAGEVTFTLTEGSGEQEPETVEVALGDVNMDGAIDQFDYILIKRAYFETIELNDAQKELADVNADGVIDQFDYILVKRHYFETFKIEGVVEVPAELIPAE